MRGPFARRTCGLAAGDSLHVLGGSDGERGQVARRVLRHAGHDAAAVPCRLAGGDGAARDAIKPMIPLYALPFQLPTAGARHDQAVIRQVELGAARADGQCGGLDHVIVVVL